MDQIINELKHNLKILSPKLIFNKEFLMYLIRFFASKLWHTLLFQLSNLKKSQFLNYFFFKRNLVEPNSNFLSVKPVSGISIDFFNICIEEYISGRKYGNNLVLVEDLLKKIFWINLESFFNNVIYSFLSKKNLFSAIFFFFECIRFEKYNSIISRKTKSSINRYKLFHYYFKFISGNHRKLLKKLIKKKLLEKYFCYNIVKEKNLHSNYLKYFYKNPFDFEKITISCTFLNYFNSFIRLNLLNLRKTIYNLSIFGVTGYDIFWFKYTKRTFHNLILGLLLKKIELEIIFIKKKLKNETKFSHYKIKGWYNSFVITKTTNFEKIALIFGAALMNLNNDEKSFTYQVHQLGSFSIWNKYLTGYIYSMMHSNQKVLYEFLPIILNNTTVSEYLKGGLIFGLSLDLKNQFELEKTFLKKYRIILKSKNFPIVKYGVCLALSTLLSKCILYPEKSEIFLELKDQINLDDISSEGACLAIGFLFLNSGSIFLLKELLLMIMETFDENKIKMLLTSISFIFCKNRDYSNYLFEHLIKEKNPQIRIGAVRIYSLGNFMNIELNSIKMLLKYLSNENDDNVKFTLVSSIGFIFISKYHVIEEILFHFINHYNSFVRLGLCFSICTSSLGLKNISKQIKILQKILGDEVDFVSQGAAFCLGLLHFFSPSQRGIIKTVYLLKSIINNNLKPKITKFGAIIGLSVIEIKKKEIFGRYKKVFLKPEILNIFLQYWTWLPNIIFGFEFLL